MRQWCKSLLCSYLLFYGAKRTSQIVTRGVEQAIFLTYGCEGFRKQHDRFSARNALF